MKKSIGILAVSILMAGSVLTSCSTPSEDVEDAQENLEDAKKELEESQAYLEEVESYRTETEAQIASNEQSITEFNDRIATQKLEAKAEYQKKIAELDAKNSDMKKKLDDFNTDNRASWEKFKTEFSRDMEDLGNAFRDFGVESKK